ncbi:yipf5 [Symbiodinium microadriaticum]|nr:yipf5 [Symbiodinium microadriaticum]
MINHALDADRYSGTPQGDFGADFGDFDSTAADQDPWYSKSSDKSSPIGSYGQDIPQTYARNDEINISYTGGYDGDENYEAEPPLLEELGIRFDHIWTKTQAVLVPNKEIDDHILDDADLAGPLVYCMLFGAVLLLTGKVHFGYIYGFSIFGCSSLCAVINLLDSHEKGLDIWKTSSVLGYSLLPIIGLAVFSIVLSLKGIIGLVLSVAAIAWSTHVSTR